MSKKIALIEAKPSNTNFKTYFDFDYDRYSLTSDITAKKVLKKNTDIKINLDDYELIILVGSEPLKMYTGVTSISDYTGTLVDEKFLPILNPSMLYFKPEIKPAWEKSVYFILEVVSKGAESVKIRGNEGYEGIEGEAVALAEIQDAIDYLETDYVAIDTETTSLYPRNGHILGISLSYKADKGVYISNECITQEVVDKLQELANKKTVVFHNAKFDISMLEYHYNLDFPNFEDTMLQHYTLDESRGTHGLKSIAIKFTEYGGYDRELTDYIDDYRKRYGIKKDAFKWEWIPFNIMKTYAAKDAGVTYLLHAKFRNLINKNPKLKHVYEDLLIPSITFLKKMENNGIPFSKDRLIERSKALELSIRDLNSELHMDPNVVLFEALQGEKYNPNSPLQTRKLLFDQLSLPPTGILTDTKQNSTNAKALEILAGQHNTPKIILKLKQEINIKNNYIDKILPQLDKDSCLRTNFNLHVTTSGRLSSSGKLNMQQLHRDNPTVKGCIMAPEGYSIVTMDLQTAEMYVAAAISKDPNLCAVFSSKQDFHSTMAIQVFNLKCEASQVKEMYPEYRQWVKAISFGILYGASAYKISKEAGISQSEAEEIIAKYFKRFSVLHTWIEDSKNFIIKNKFIYSTFGRKRRLLNVSSEDKGLAAHEVRSGLNFKIQSDSSDIVLLGSAETYKELESKKLEKLAKIFALVHDSTSAVVRDDLVEEYSEILVRNIQADRGVSIPSTPIGCDFSVSRDYSAGKYEKYFYPEFDEEESEELELSDI